MNLFPLCDHGNTKLEIKKGLLANGTLPLYLQRLEQHVIPFSECRHHWEGQITERMFCVTADFFDTCNGKEKVHHH